MLFLMQHSHLVEPIKHVRVYDLQPSGVVYWPQYIALQGFF